MRKLVSNIVAVALLAGLIIGTGCSNRKYVKSFELDSAPPVGGFQVPERITAGVESSFSPDLSRNGAYVLFTTDRMGNKDIFEKKVNGGYARALTDHPADDFSPVISPNGKRVAFVSRRDDAAGDIHVMDLGVSAGRLIGKIEGKTYRVKLTDTEDFHPAWFSDSENLVFARRKAGERDAQIFRADHEGDRIEPVGDIKGEQPAISHDDKMMVYVRDGALYLYDFTSGVSMPLTSGEIVKDGQPRFSEDDKSILFIRYADDTNHDRTLNGDDRPTIWRLPIADMRQANQKAAPAERFLFEPLTAARTASYNPAERGSSIYFSELNHGSIDIYRMPKVGVLLLPEDEEQIDTYVDRTVDVDSRLLVLRRSSWQFLRKGQPRLAAKYVARELELLVELGARETATWLHKRVRTEFPSDKSLALFAELAMLELDLADVIFPRYDQTGDADVETRLDEGRDRLRTIMEALNTEQVEDRQNLAAKADLLAARRDRALVGKKVETQDILLRIVRDQTILDRYRAEALILSALTLAQDKKIDEGIRVIVAGAEDFDNNHLIQRRFAATLIALASGNGKIVQDRIATIKASVKSGLALASILQNELAKGYVTSGQLYLATNELQDIILNRRVEIETVIEALGLYLRCQDKLKQEDSVAWLYKELQANIQRFDKATVIKFATLFAEYYVRRASESMSRRDLAKADRFIKRALEIDPENINAHTSTIEIKYQSNEINREIVMRRENYEKSRTDPVKTYLFATALSYKINDYQSVREKLRMADESIGLLEDARNRAGHIAQIHHRLGWVYLQKGRWQNALYQSKRMGARFAHKWSLVRDYFGFGDPNWLELSIDAYLTSFFLMPEESSDRLTILAELGDVYFELGNHAKSLNYYMQRIDRIADVPMPTIKDEGALLLKAAKSAFYAENIDVAEVLYKRLSRFWRQYNYDEGLAQALDGEALVYREKKQFPLAVDVYQSLLNLQNRLGNARNIIGTHINLAYCLYYDERFAEALRYLDEAEQRIKNESSTTSSAPVIADEDAIQVEVGGQGSLAKGFDDDMRRILILTYKARIYQNLNLPELAIAALQAKDTLLVHRKRELGKGERDFLEDISVNRNQMALQQETLGMWKASSEAFLEVSKDAAALRPSSQNWPTTLELSNIRNAMTIKVRLKALGLLTDDDQRQAIQLLSETIDALNTGVLAGEKSMGGSLVELLAFKTQLLGDSSGSQGWEQVWLKAKDTVVERPPLYLASVYGNKLSGQNIDENDKTLARQLRREILGQDKYDWKMHVVRGEWSLAFQQLTLHVGKGASLDNVVDRKLVLTVFEHVFRDTLANNPGDVAAGAAIVQKFSHILNSELVNRMYKGLDGQPEGTPELLVSYPLSRVRAQLDDNEVITLVHGLTPKERVFFNVSKQRVEYGGLLQEDDFATAIVSTARKLIASNSVKLYGVFTGYISAGRLYRNFAHRLPTDVSFSVLPSAESLIFIKANRLLRQRSVTLMPKAEGHRLFEPSDVPEFTFRQVDAKTYQIGHYPEIKTDVLIDQSEVRLSSPNGNNSQLLVNDHQSGNKSAISLAQLPAGYLDFVQLAIFPDVRFKAENIAELEFDEGLRALSVSLLGHRVGSIVVGGDDSLSKVAVVRLLSELSEQSLSVAARSTGVGVLLIGDQGFSKNEITNMATERMSSDIARGKNLLAAGQYHRAARFFDEAVYLVENYAGPLSQRLEALEGIESASLKSGDYEGYARARLGRIKLTADPRKKALDMLALLTTLTDQEKAESGSRSDIAFAVIADFDAELNALKAIDKSSYWQLLAIKVQILVDRGRYEDVTAILKDERDDVLANTSDKVTQDVLALELLVLRKYLGRINEGKELLAKILAVTTVNQMSSMLRAELLLYLGIDKNVIVAETGVETLTLLDKINTLHLDECDCISQAIEQWRYDRNLNGLPTGVTLVRKALQESKPKNKWSYRHELCRIDLLRGEGDHAGAVSALDELLSPKLAKSPGKDALVKYKLAQTLTDMGQFAPAQKYYADLQKEVPLGTFLYHAQQVRRFKAVLGERPTNSDQNGRLEEEIAAVEQGAGAKGFLSLRDELCLLKGDFFSLSGDRAKAQSEYRRCGDAAKVRGDALLVLRANIAELMLASFQQSRPSKSEVEQLVNLVITNIGTIKLLIGIPVRQPPPSIAGGPRIIEFLVDQLVHLKEYGKAQRVSLAWLTSSRGETNELRDYRSRYLAKLLPDEMLVHFFCSRSFLYVWLNRSRETNFVKVRVSQDRIENLMRTYNYLVANLASTQSIDEDLSKIFVQPITKSIDPKIKKLTFYNAGMMSRVNYSALNYMAGKIVDAMTVRYLRSISDLATGPPAEDTIDQAEFVVGSKTTDLRNMFSRMQQIYEGQPLGAGNKMIIYVGSPNDKAPPSRSNCSAKVCLLNEHGGDEFSQGLLAKNFYRRVLSGLPADEAFRLSQLSVRKSHPHVSAWAASRLVGKNVKWNH